LRSDLFSAWRDGGASAAKERAGASAGSAAHVIAKHRGVPKSALVREAIEAKVALEAAMPRRPANLLEALGDSVGSIASGKRDLASHKKHFRGFGRRSVSSPTPARSWPSSIKAFCFTKF
jgi:hypothetical protein